VPVLTSAVSSLAIAFDLGDAESLPFADGEFDAVVSTFGVMFATRPESAARSRACAAAAWRTFSRGDGPTRVLAGGLDPGRRAALRDDFIAFHARFATDLGICVPRTCCVAVGTRM